jgi:carboxymethylenebutenolidase
MYAGKVAAPGDREATRSYMQSVIPAEGTGTVRAWVKWLKAHRKATGKVGTIGWCFGGGLSLDASIAAPVDATVIYYGRVDADAGELKSLKGPVLGHFATEDKWINKKMVSAFEAEMDKAGKPYKNHWYEAQHAFANPTGARYDKKDAKLAWKRTTAFFEKNLGG